MTRPAFLFRLQNTLLLAFICLGLAACSDAPQHSVRVAAQGGVFTLELDATGERAVVGAVHDGGSLWQISEGRKLHDLNHRAGDETALVASAFSPDGSRVVTAERNAIVMWDVTTGAEVGLWTTEAEIQSLALSEAGRVLVVGLRDSRALLIDTGGNFPTGQVHHASTVSAVAVTRDGSIALTGSDDGKVRAWNLADGSERLAWNLASGVSTITLSPDNSRVFVGRFHGRSVVYDLNSGQRITEIGQDRSSIISARFSSDNARLLTGFPNGQVVLWNLADGRAFRKWQAPRETLRHPTAMVATDVAFGQRPGQIVAGFSNGTVLSWGP